MCVVKTEKINNITVNIHDDYIPKDKDEYKKNLKVVYDTINMIFKDTSSVYYTSEELEQLQKTNKEIFI